MPLPSLTFIKMLPDLQSFVNNKIKPNGAREIDGDALNNVLNALIKFIVEYTMNGNLGDIKSTTGVATLEKPINVFTAVPSSVVIPDNVQNEYVFVNATGSVIDISPFGYTDTYGTSFHAIAPRDVVHISKLTNGSWIRINHPPGSGSGGGADLPPQFGNAGKSLITTGDSVFWGDLMIAIRGSDFADSVRYVNSYLQHFDFQIFCDEMNRHIFVDTGEWVRDSATSFRITIPGFDSTNPEYAQWHFHITLKARN